jgi:4-hydroxy-2-oxoheptanedioate aldolase
VSGLTPRRPGATAWGGWSTLGSPAAAEALARSGCDFVVLDAQHGLWDDAATAQALAVLGGGASAGAAPALVRVRAADDALVGRALDAGAAGVVVPMVADGAHAAEVAAACRYPPRGHRSWGPLGSLRGRAVPSAPDADAVVTCAVMVEVPSALADVGAVAAAPGVDAVLVGPFDLSLALGTTVDALLADDGPGGPLPRVVAACADAGIVAAAYAGSVERGVRLAELGFAAVAVVTDAGLVADGAAEAVRRARGTSEG